MAENRGIAPPDMDTPLGKLRAILGDVTYTELDPAEPGFGNYAMFSDTELDAFLALSDSSVEGGAFFAYTQMAGAAARESTMTRDFDLQVDLTKRATDLRMVAGSYKNLWDSAAADIFEVFDIGAHDRCIPELAPFPIRRCV